MSNVDRLSRISNRARSMSNVFQRKLFLSEWTKMAEIHPFVVENAALL